MSYLSLLDKTATVTRGTESKGASKETVRTFATVASSVACSIQVRKGQQRKSDPGTFKSQLWDGYFPPTLDIRASDRVTENGNTFEVMGVEPIRGKVLQATLRQMSVAAS